jgi:hypothetical protein
VDDEDDDASSFASSSSSSSIASFGSASDSGNSGGDSDVGDDRLDDESEDDEIMEQIVRQSRAPRLPAALAATPHAQSALDRARPGGSSLQQKYFSKSNAIDAARALGAERRKRRTAMLKSLKAGGLKLSDVLKLATDKRAGREEEALTAGRTRVKQLVLAMPHIAKTKVAEILSLAHIDPRMTVSALCTPQKRVVLENLIKVMLDRVPSLRIPGVLGLQLRPVE